MRLLHVGSGFRPWRHGGLVAYVEDLLDAQRARGDDVAYFFAGRQYPVARRTRLRRWERRGIPMLEVIDSPLYDHGAQPELELAEPRTEQLFARVLAELRPDVVHVHELAGLPSSLLDVAHRAGVPAVVTLQDYFPVCSTFKLLDAAGRVCTRLEIGEDCAANVRAGPRRPGLMVEATLRHDLRRLQDTRLHRFAWDAARRLGDRTAAPAPAPPAAFPRRREVHVERLHRAGRVIAMSRRVAEIYTRLGVRDVQTIHLTLAHIAGLSPRPPREQRPLVFATLAGFESPAKGAHVLIDAMRLLAGRGTEVTLRVFGYVDPAIRAAADGVPGIEIARPFSPAQLDAILDDVDVGIVPSIWEEAYGYVGVEFLAKAIPVIANAIGGMPDYVVPGETGWLNRSCAAAELADIMAAIAAEPASAAALHARMAAQRPAVVKPMDAHAGEMAAVYSKVAVSCAS